MTGTASGAAPDTRSSLSSAGAIERWLVEALAALLGLDPQDVDPRERFTRYGLDSAGALRLIAQLGKLLDRPLPATLLWDRPTIASVSAHLAGGSRAAPDVDRPRSGGELAEEPIAVVGIACRLPGARDPEAFWRLLRDGIDAITEVPADRWDVDDYFDADLRAPGKMNTRWGGFLERVDGFDAAFFGISPREAVEMDPQQRLMLQVAWEALEDAGQPPLELRSSRTGVYFGALSNDYAALRQRGEPGYITTHTATGAHYSIIANRVSYVLGLQGPSMTIDSACSSSLVAVHLACQSLRSGETALALAGGVTLIVAPESTIAMSKLGAMAPDGRSRAFDAAASGYVRGEGAGVVVLKRLSHALASGDRIYGVIRGSAVNNDGYSNGLTAPNPEAQERMLRDAYRNARVATTEVQYIEAHGTGTPLGDPIEAKALGAVLGAGRPPERPCLIGSVKTNVGHLEAAAGVTGLIKVLLAMTHGELPASLHFTTPNPHIPFEELRLQVQTRRTAWTTEDGPRLAGVSSFGFGGTNCHVVVADLPSERPHVLPLGAGSAAALDELAREVDGLLGAEAASLPAIARSAAAHASRGEHRLAVTASSVEDARRAIAQHLAGHPHPSVVRGAGATAPRIVFVCSGHGSQWWGMGRETLHGEPAFRAKLEECDEAMRPLTGWSVLEELTCPRSRSRLSETDVVQPLIFAIQVAQAELWRSWGIEPRAVVGHSIGEVSAAHIAGILDLPDAARVICTRSRLIREHASGRGQLAVVELPAEELQRHAGAVLERLSIAAFNGPTTTVVGGDPDPLRELMATLAARDVFCQLVNIDYASHTRHMDFLRAPLTSELVGLRARRSEIPMISTVTASILDGTRFDAEYWASNEQQPVQFWRCIAELARQGHDTFIELGGHPLLARSMRAALAHAGAPGQVVPSFRRDEEARPLREGVAALHAAGAPIRWSALHAPGAAPLLPTWGAAPAAPDRPPAHLFTLSARDEAALRAHAEAVLVRIAQVEHGTEPVADLCYTSNVRRSHLDVRLAARCASVEELGARLRSFVQAPGGAARPAAHRRPRMAFVFPGQGGQWWRMGRELLRDEPVFRLAIDACDEALRASADWSLREELERDEAASRIHDIDLAQPATFALQVALAALWRSWGIVPDAVVGHSMGEVAAAHVAGALSLEDAVRVIRHRSRLMRRVAGAGAMAVVELSRDEAQRAIAGERALLSVAGSNSPKACVLSGDPAALARVLGRLDERGVFHRLLRVDVASHSPQMDPLRDELVGLLGGLAPRPAELAIFSSVTADARAGETLDAAYWGRNLREPFLFADTIARMAERGYTLFVEIGPHPILSGAIGDVQQLAGKELVALPSLKREEDERAVMLDSLAALYERGFAPAWRKLHLRGGRFVALPSYPWQEERYWPAQEELQRGASHAARLVSSPRLRRLSVGPPPASADVTRAELWELDLGAHAHPYLADRVVQGEVVMPGTAQLELVLGAAGRLFGEGLAVAQVAFERALSLPAGITQTVQVAIAPAADGGHVFWLSSRPAGDAPKLAWTRHATGRLEVARAAEREVHAPANVAAIQARLARLSASSHYASLEQLGLHHGPAFRGVEEIWRTDGEALALVARPAALDAEPRTHAFHPALLDAALLQGVYAAVPAARLAAAAGDTFVPAGIGRLRLLAPLGDRMWSHARLRPPSEVEPDAFEADLQIFDQAGKTLAEADGIRFQRLGAGLLEGGEHDPAQWQYELQWQPRAATPDAPQGGPAPEAGTWIVLLDRGGLGRELVASLEAGGGTCLCVEAGDADTWTHQLEDAFRRGGDDVRGVVHLRGLDLPREQRPEAVAELERACMELVRVVHALVERTWSRSRLWVVTRGAQPVSPAGEDLACGQAVLWGLGRTIDAEHPEIWGGLADVGADRADLRALCAELTGAGEETQLAFRAGKRFVLRLVRAAVPAQAPFRCRLDGTYLITGGLEGPGPELARWLVEHGARRLVLLEGSTLPDRSRWDDAHPPSVRARITAVRTLELAGAAVAIVGAEVGDPAQMRAAFEALRASGPPIRGIVHAAGANAPGTLATLAPEKLSASFRAKVAGTLVLDELLRGTELDFLVLCSSIESVLGVRGRAPYAAASSFLDLYAHRRRRAGLPAVAIHWGMWERQAVPALGLLGMAPGPALEHLGAVLQAGVPERIISAIDWRVLRAAFASTPGRTRYLEDIASASPPPKPTTATAPLESFAGQLASAPPAERAPLLAAHLRTMIAAVLRCPVEKLDLDRPLNTVGLDSILAADVRNRIQFGLGVRIQMLALFRGITTKELAAQVLEEVEAARSRAGGGQAPEPEPLRLAPALGRARFEPFPFTDIQHAYWVGRQGVLPWGNTGTHIYLEIDGALDPDRLDRAWQRMLARHDMLRAVILPLGEQQIPEQPLPYRIPVVDLSGVPSFVRQAALERERQRMSTSIPPIEAWPHFELLLHVLDEGRTRLHVNLDAILIDAFSIDQLFKDWGAFYEDPDRTLPPIEISFRDYVLAEAALVQGSDAAKRSEEYWAGRMHALPPPPQLPEHPAPNTELLARPRFGHYLGSLEPRRWQALKARASEIGLTPSSVMCAAFAEVLSYWSKEPHFTITLTQFRRFPLHPDVNKIIGDFTSTILLEIDWSCDPTFLGRARRLTEQLWTDMDHSLVSGVRVLRDLSRSRRTPLLMPIVFTSALDDLGPGMRWAGTMGYLASESSQVYLDSRITESNGALVYGWDVLEEYFPPGVLAAMFQSYEELLLRLADGDAVAWGEHPRAMVVDRRWQELAAINATGVPMPAELLHQLGLASLNARPRHPAVITPGKTLSYEELFRRARQIGHRLRELGARPNRLVAVAAQPGWERIVAALGVLESGAAYLPVDPALPTERMAYLLENGQVELVLTPSWLDEGLSWPANVRRIRIDDPSLAESDPGPLAPVQTPDDLAYVIFTSGSTGKPKGVMIDHRGAVNTIRDLNARFGINFGDRVLALSNLSFDLSVYDIFGLLAAGGTIVLPDPSLERDPAHWARLVATHQVTIWNTVPQLLQMLVDCPGVGTGELGVSTLRLALLSGDWIPIDLPLRIQSLVPELEIVSLGGATEASIWSIIYPIREQDPAWRSIPYGQPMVNQHFYVLNERLEPCPTWVTGHLYIGGVGLARGYWGDEARTNASFVRHPRTGERLYRTGDLGRYMKDGCTIEFLGREDSQVKINGFRIELGEIEAALRQHPSVEDCYILVRNWRNKADVPWEAAAGAGRGAPKAQNRFLVAYVVRNPAVAFSEADVRSYLKQKLPDFMVPSRVLEIERVPLSANGKVDRRALPDPDEVTRDTEALLAPRTDLERILVGMWSTTLGLAVERIGVQDNFFDLGGNSLLLVKVSGLIAKHFAIQLRVTELFQSPTVESLARRLDEIRGAVHEEEELEQDLDPRDRAARRKELKARLGRRQSEPEL